MTAPDSPLDHPLLTWLRAASAEQRDDAAKRIGTEVNYLYQIAAYRREPKVCKAFAVEDVTRQMHEESGGLLPVVTARQLAEAWTLAGLGV